jgi:hypothetical protein
MGSQAFHQQNNPESRVQLAILDPGSHYRLPEPALLPLIHSAVDMNAEPNSSESYAMHIRNANFVHYFSATNLNNLRL